MKNLKLTIYKFNVAKKQLLHDLGREPISEEIAAETGFDIRRVRLYGILSYLQRHRSATIIGLIIFLLFFWFGIRPAIIRSHCDSWAIKSTQNVFSIKKERLKTISQNSLYRSAYESYYKQCLRKQGLKE